MTVFRHRLRLFLLLAAFIVGQLAMLAHAAELHDEGEASGHVCLLCLAGHDLQGAAPPASAGALALPAAPCHGVSVAPAAPPQRAVVRCRARAPPLA